MLVGTNLYPNVSLSVGFWMEWGVLSAGILCDLQQLSDVYQG